MKNKKWTYALCYCFFLLSPWLLAQEERMYLMNGDSLDVQVENISGRRIGYFIEVNGRKMFQTIATRKVRRIVSADETIYDSDKPGKDLRPPTEEPTEERRLTHKDLHPLYQDISLYTKQRKQALKVHLLAPLQGHTTISYERNLRPGRGLEYSLGIIGLGENSTLYYRSPTSFEQLSTRENQKGLHVGVGYKLYAKPVVRYKGQGYRHLLEGWYIMPKVIAGSFTKNAVEYNDFTGVESIENKQFRFAGLMLYGGKQAVYFGSVLLDWQVGIGLGGSNHDRSDEDERFNYYPLLISSSYLAIGGGVRLGFLF